MCTGQPKFRLEKGVRRDKFDFVVARKEMQNTRTPATPIRGRFRLCSLAKQHDWRIRGKESTTCGESCRFRGSIEVQKAPSQVLLPETYGKAYTNRYTVTTLYSRRLNITDATCCR